MDKSKSPIPPSDVLLQSASERTSADTDPRPAELAKLDQLVPAERQSRSGHVEPCGNGLPDGPSAAAVYYRSEEEVREGFLMALSAMGVAGVEQLPEPAEPPTGGEKP